MLHTLQVYTEEWNLTVKLSKTKIVLHALRNGGKLRHHESWTYMYNNLDLEIVYEFKYLGVLFNYNGNFLNMQKHAAE
jgi:hypothetical protein